MTGTYYRCFQTSQEKEIMQSTAWRTDAYRSDDGYNTISCQQFFIVIPSTQKRTNI